MSAATKPIEPVALHETSRRHRPVSALATAQAQGNDESEAEALIRILADALESIVECTSDASARSIACEALVMFHGR